MDGRYVGQEKDTMSAIARYTLALLIAGCLSCFAQQQTETAPRDALLSKSRPRELNPEDALGKAYYEASKSIEAAEQFMREHPQERDLCAGALFIMADLQKQKDKKQAIQSYQKAVDTYGDEVVPDVNFTCTVADWALLRIARLERDTGNSPKALEIFGKLMTTAEVNTRNKSRTEYLLLKQSHLKVVAVVAVQRKGPYSIGAKIPVTVTIRNLADEAVIFKCYSSISGSLAPRSGCEETTLAAGEEAVISMEYTAKDTKWMKPGVYELKAVLFGIPFDTNSVTVEIKK